MRGSCARVVARASIGAEGYAGNIEWTGGRGYSKEEDEQGMSAATGGFMISTRATRPNASYTHKSSTIRYARTIGAITSRRAGELESPCGRQMVSKRLSSHRSPSALTTRSARSASATTSAYCPCATVALMPAKAERKTVSSGARSGALDLLEEEEEAEGPGTGAGAAGGAGSVDISLLVAAAAAAAAAASWSLRR